MRLFWFTAIIACLLGLSSAYLAQAFVHDRIAIVGTFIGLHKTFNPGIAFGIQLPPVLQAMLIGLATAIVCWIALQSEQSTIGQIAFGLILGGALGNIIDRLPDGLVTDYFQIGSFPIFNVPDAFINIGVGLLLLEMIITSSRSTHNNTNTH